MLGNMLRYELERYARPFALYLCAAAALALFGGLRPGGLPFDAVVEFYLFFFAAAAYMLVRFWRVQCGAEAERVFSAPLSPEAQTASRFCALLIASAASTLALLLSLRAQGGPGMSALVRALSPATFLFLWAAVALSQFAFVSQGALVLVLSGLAPFRRRRLVCAVVFAAALYGLRELAGAALRRAVPGSLILEASGRIRLSADVNVPASFGLSLSACVWEAATLPIIIAICARLTRTRLTIAG